MKMRISLGPIAGLFAVLILILDYLVLLFWQWMDPDESIDQARGFDYKAYSKNREAFGDHTFRVDNTKARVINKFVINNNPSSSNSQPKDNEAEGTRNKVSEKEGGNVKSTPAKNNTVDNNGTNSSTSSVFISPSKKRKINLSTDL
jgi:hypothetical protein